MVITLETRNIRNLSLRGKRKSARNMLTSAGKPQEEPGIVGASRCDGGLIRWSWTGDPVGSLV